MTQNNIEAIRSIVISHAGRKGMKWYQNIFTNPDGSSKDKRTTQSAEERQVQKLKKKKVSKLSDAELIKVTERLKLEAQYDVYKNAYKEGSGTQKFKNLLTVNKQVIETATGVAALSGKIVEVSSAIKKAKKDNA